LGYAGVYSSFLKHAYRAAERYRVSGAEILLRCGQRKLVGGQEDQIIDIALEIAAEQGAPAEGGVVEQLQEQVTERVTRPLGAGGPGGARAARSAVAPAGKVVRS
jgi:hypothetical protein